MEQDTWLEVDDTGHVSGVASELPHGHKVLLDASGNIMAIVAIEEAVTEPEKGDTSTTPPEAPEAAQGSTEANTPLAPETPLDASVSESATSVAPVAEPVMSEQAHDSTTVQAVSANAPDNVAGYFTLLGNNETGSTVVAGYLPIEQNAPDNVASPIAVGGTAQEEAAQESGNTQE